MQIAIVYHSAGGSTKVQAQRVLEGVQSIGGNDSVRLLSVSQLDWNYLDNCDTIIFGCPTYMGGVSAELKMFMDESDRTGRWLSNTWGNKLAAGFTNSGGLSGDKTTCLMQMVVFACGMGMIWISEGSLPRTSSPDYPGLTLNRLASSLGAMAQTPDGDTHPIKDDLATAIEFGKRVAIATERWLNKK